MSLKVFKPQVFQGDLGKKNYFEGWYFKLVSIGLDHVYSFIPGISLTRDNPHCFIQVINGISGESSYLSYPVDQFKWNKNLLEVRVGNSIFTEAGIKLDIDHSGVQIKGQLNYSKNIGYPRSLRSPGIMGWYSFVPFMQCKHDVVSVTHELSGTLEVNGESIDFSHGKGYIEKDWGSSFPKAWLWLHCNTFEKEDASLMISVADIPWLGSYFLGLISFLYVNEKFYMFNTYDGSSIQQLSQENETITVHLKNKQHLLKVTIVRNKSGELKAPVKGGMSRRIKESIDSSVHYELTGPADELIAAGNGHRAGLETIEAIFHYL
jgi:tocopherol cyclase